MTAPLSINNPAGRTRPRILVVGTGPAGLVAALSLAGTGAHVTLGGPEGAATGNRPDQRTTALFGGSVELLKHLQAWPHLSAHATPLTGLRLIDDTGALLKAPEMLFSAQEIGAAEFGFNIANADLVRELARLCAGHPAITRVTASVQEIRADTGAITADFASGQSWTGALVAGADGRNSLCRRAAGIGERTWSYPQTAIASRFAHSRPHNGISTEFHRRAGPLTTVPLPGNQSSLVWVETPEEARRIMQMDEPAFTRALEARLQGLLGEIGSIGPRVAFPLSSLTADPVARARTVLVGEAAHVLPPIGAQGLNLGFRDAAWLAEIVATAIETSEDTGGESRLAAYAEARRSDVLLRGLAVDLLNRSLLAGLLPVDLARGAGMAVLGAFPWLRRLAIDSGMGNSSLGAGRPLPPLLRPYASA